MGGIINARYDCRVLKWNSIFTWETNADVNANANDIALPICIAMLCNWAMKTKMKNNKKSAM